MNKWVLFLIVIIAVGGVLIAAEQMPQHGEDSQTFQLTILLKIILM